MQAGNWESYQDYCNRSSFFKRERELDEREAAYEKICEDFIEKAVERLGEDYHDEAENYITEQDEDFLSKSSEKQVDEFELWLEINKEDN